VDNRVDELEAVDEAVLEAVDEAVPEAVDEAVPAIDLAEQEETKSDNKKKKDTEPSTVTPIEKDLTRSFVPKAPYPERLRV
jgi:phage I-like protein